MQKSVWRWRGTGYTELISEKRSVLRIKCVYCGQANYSHHHGELA